MFVVAYYEAVDQIREYVLREQRMTVSSVYMYVQRGTSRLLTMQNVPAIRVLHAQ